MTPYQRGQAEWDSRIGTARVQARNWRILALLSLVVTVLLLMVLIIEMSTNKVRLFVAQVTSSGQVVNVQMLATQYHPTTAQEEYFIKNFIELIRELPLDPVVAKNNWLKAYDFLSSRGAERLNAYFRQNNPVELLGKKTVNVKITTINQISDKTFEAEWTESVVNANGQDEGQKNYAGVFTLTLNQPTTQSEILQNPLGIYIVDFSLSPKN